MAEGRLYLGMRAPFATIAFYLRAPAGVDFTTATLSLSIDVQPEDESADAVTLGAWLFTPLSASRVQAKYLPNGSEFAAAIPHKFFNGVLTIDGQPADLVGFTERVYEPRE